MQAGKELGAALPLAIQFFSAALTLTALTTNSACEFYMSQVRPLLLTQELLLGSGGREIEFCIPS